MVGKKINLDQIIAYLAVFAFAFVLPFSTTLPISAPLAAGIFPLYVTPAVHWSDIGVLGLWAAFLIQKGWLRLSARRMLSFTLPLLVIAALGLITAPAAINPSLALYTVLRWLIALTVFLALVTSLVPPLHIALAVVSSALSQAAVAWIQALFQRPLGLPGEMTLALQNHQSAAIYFSGGAWLRAYGLTFHPNVLGGLLAIGILLLSLWLRQKRAFIALILLAGGLFFTFSRSAWIAAGILAPILWFRLAQLDRSVKRHMRILLLSGMIGVGILFAWFMPQVITRLNPFTHIAEYTSLSGRGEMLRITLETFASHPLTGIGAGNFPLQMRSYPTLDEPQFVHNVPLLLAAEVGILGAAAWLWLWLSPAVRLRSFLNSPQFQPFVFTAALFAWGLIALWDSYPWSLETGRLMTAVLVSLTARAYGESSSAA
jgi:O-antigen ligase